MPHTIPLADRLCCVATVMGEMDLITIAHVRSRSSNRAISSARATHRRPTGTLSLGAA
jgi:hypothetical protein